MTGDLIGNPVNAVLIPPQAEAFASLVGVNVETLDVNVTGFNKLVLLGGDRVFLFPREAGGVEWFEREIAAYQALEATGLAMVPRLLEYWNDPRVYPFPFAAVTRMRGRVPAEPELLIEQLARAIGAWHELDATELRGARPPRHLKASHHQWLRRALDPQTTEEAAAQAADRLGRPDRVPRWSELLSRAAQLRPVLVHGDIHEDQLLAEDGQLTGIIDWETARVDHPFWDFDLGEWGTGLWRRRRRDFSDLWSRAWRAYAEVRGLSTDPAPLEAAFRLRQALHLLGDPSECGAPWCSHDPAITGTLDEHLAYL